MNPILAALQTAEIAVNEIGLKRDGIIAILMQTSVIDGDVYKRQRPDCAARASRQSVPTGSNRT